LHIYIHDQIIITMKKKMTNWEGAALLSSKEQKAINGGWGNIFTCGANCYIYSGYDACLANCECDCQRGLFAECFSFGCL
jgi:hypothetical protein